MIGCSNPSFALTALMRDACTTGEVLTIQLLVFCAQCSLLNFVSALSFWARYLCLMYCDFHQGLEPANMGHLTM